MTRTQHLGSAQQQVLDVLTEVGSDGIDLRDISRTTPLSPRRVQQIVTTLAARGMVRTKYRSGYDHEQRVPMSATRVWLSDQYPS